MWNNFSRVLTLKKLLYESWVSNSRFSLLYIEVWKIRCKLPAHQIKSFETWSDHQWSYAWFGYCPMKDQFQILPSLEEHRCRHSSYSCPVVDTKQSSGGGGCTLRTIVLFQRSQLNKHLMPSNSFEIAVCFILPIFYNDRCDLIFIWTTFWSSSVFQLLLIFSS